MAIRTYKVTLDSKNTIAPEPVYLRQGDKTGAVVIDATLMDNGSPVSLSGLTPMFKANTADGQAVIADSTGFMVTDSANGKFTYQVPNALSSVPGKITTAYFSLSDAHGSESTFDVAFIIKAATDMSKTQAEDYITIIDGTLRSLEEKINDFNTPETFVNLDAIKAKYPSGKNGVMVAADNGHKYIWSNGTWTDAGVYQSVGIGDKTVTTSKLADSSVIPLKTNFISENPKNINLFDKNSEDNWFGKVFSATGDIQTLSGWNYSHSIPCNSGDIFRAGTSKDKNAGYAGVFNGEQWIANVNVIDGYYFIPKNIPVTSIRFAIQQSVFESTMIVLLPNELPNEYIPFNFLLDSQIKLDYANLENVSVGENGVTLLNPISGKTVSIVGDSYSAFTGWIPEGNSIKYDGTYNGVTSVTNMWWYKVIQKFNMSLMLNESWSGSTICNTGYNASDATATSFLTRITNRYGATNTLGQKPQVLFVLGGLNDTWANAPLGTAKYSDWTTDDLKTVLGAYSKMINEILLYNPGIEIINFEYAAVSKAIRDGKALICEHFGVKNVSISAVDSLEGHPTTTGMQQIADQITTALNV